MLIRDEILTNERVERLFDDIIGKCVVIYAHFQINGHQFAQCKNSFTIKNCEIFEKKPKDCFQIMLGVQRPNKHVALPDYSVQTTANWWKEEINQFHAKVLYLCISFILITYILDKNEISIVINRMI